MSEQHEQWMREHKASQWDFRIDGESDAARNQRLLRSQRLCGNCGDLAKKACLRKRQSLVVQYGFPVAGVWGGRIFGEDVERLPDPTEMALMPREDAA